MELLQEGIGFVLVGFGFDFLSSTSSSSSSSSTTTTTTATTIPDATQDLQYPKQSQNDPLAVGRILQNFPKEVRLFREAFFESSQEVAIGIVITTIGIVITSSSFLVVYQLVQ